MEKITESILRISVNPEYHKIFYLKNQEYFEFYDLIDENTKKALEKARRMSKTAGRLNSASMFSSHVATLGLTYGIKKAKEHRAKLSIEGLAADRDFSTILIRISSQLKSAVMSEKGSDSVSAWVDKKSLDEVVQSNDIDKIFIAGYKALSDPKSTEDIKNKGLELITLAANKGNTVAQKIVESTISELLDTIGNL